MFFGAEVERQRSYKFRRFKAIFLALKLSPDLRHFFESFKSSDSPKPGFRFRFRPKPGSFGFGRNQAVSVAETETYIIT